MRRISILCGAAIACLATLAAPSPAAAGGYDTPMLYSARHMGMGGTAVAYVNDGSAMFHNPAGLGHTERANLIIDISLLTGDITGNPSSSPSLDKPVNESLTSEQTIAPLFLLGGSYRFTDWLVGGVGFYPVASAGADYLYTQDDPSMAMVDCMGTCTDNTTLLFLEGSVGLTLDFTPWGVPGLRIGATWRVTYVSIDREQEISDIAFKASGVSYAGFRVGIQYQPIDELELGVNWRSRTTTEVEDSAGVALGTPAPISTEFTLPDRLVFGAAANLPHSRIATDIEIGFNGENDIQVINVGSAPLNNVLEWKHAVTARVGGEYRLADDRLPLRLGYAWDGQTANTVYPTAFGTPPAPTNVVTAGIGWVEQNWQLNAAYAYRWGGTEVTEAGTGTTCLFCGGNGDYDISLSGIYIDFSYDWQ